MPDKGQPIRFPRGSECQCGNCDRFFTSPSGFDFHQWWRGRGDAVTLICHDPADIGMVLVSHKAGPVWQLADRDSGKASYDARKALRESIAAQEAAS